MRCFSSLGCLRELWIAATLFLGFAPCIQAAATPVSFSKEVAPIFARSCNGCHHPGKEKGGLDLTSFAALSKGGKHGAIFVPGKSSDSRLLTSVRGPEPEMPKNGDPLSPVECSVLERWIAEGAHDDTPAVVSEPPNPPIYTSPPAISSIAYSPNGQILAVAGFHEVLLLSTNQYQAYARLVGSATRIESFEFSSDGRQLAVAAGVPGVFGEIQIWDIDTQKQLHAYRVAYDSVFGVHWSPDLTRVAFGCADKTVRILEVASGKELVRFDQHSDWVFGVVFVNSGKQVVSGSRDRSLKLIDASSGALLDILNRDTEPIQCLAKHPKEDWVVFGSDVRPRLYKAVAKASNIDPNADPNAIREFENFENGVTALAFSGDGKWLASTGNPAGEVRIHDVANSQRKAILRGHEGVVFSLSFSPDGSQLATAGTEGKLRIFEWSKERLVQQLIPVPITAKRQPTTAVR